MPVSAQVQVPTEVTNPCNPLEGNCDGSSPHDPLRQVNIIADAVTDMQDDLLANWFQPGVCGNVENSVPVVVETDNIVSSFSTFSIYSPVDASYIGIGTTDLTTNLNTGIVDMVVEASDGGGQGGINQRWTLTQTVSVADGSVYVYGTIEYAQNFPFENATYQGGWIYTPGVGPTANPSSDPGFHDQVAAMYGCDPGVVAAHGFGFGNTLSLIGNSFRMLINYIRDFFIPYRPPTSCSGPKILDASGQSCNGQNIPCSDNLGDVAELLGDLPSVSQAFKKCMKGRFGCGGSSFPRLRISCSDSNNCGPCSYATANGCNIGGSTLWYCSPTTNACQCANTVFHEAAHSCGALDLQNGANYDSYRIGDWFQEEMADQLGCIGSMLARPLAAETSLD